MINPSAVARVLLAAVVLIAAPATGQTPATLSIATNPIDSGAEVYYADDLGFFAKAGLNVQIQPGQNGAAIAAAVAGNAVDIGYADIGALAKAHTRGIDFSIIAPAALWDSTVPVNAIMVSKTSPVRNAKDLNGKTIAVPGLGTAAAFVVFAWLDANGADSSTVKFIELPYSAMPAAISRGSRRDASMPRTSPSRSSALRGSTLAFSPRPMMRSANSICVPFGSRGRRGRRRIPISSPGSSR